MRDTRSNRMLCAAVIQQARAVAEMGGGNVRFTTPDGPQEIGDDIDIEIVYNSNPPTRADGYRQLLAAIGA